MNTLLLSTTYCGPVQWYQKLYRSQAVEIEQWETFQKQTYRNRCLIATTGGVLPLSIPIEHGDSMLMRDIRISDHGNWRRLHWNALQSAYGESPFFEYYQDDFRPFYEQRWTYLIDFNEAIRRVVCQLIDFEPQVRLSADFRKPGGPDDYRYTITPKHQQAEPDATFKPYYQVYRQKHGFLPNLSILDLLFNMGPESIYYL